jgi:hypothetical protein
MKYKLLCCEVFMRMACLAIADSPHTIDPEYTRLGAHENSDSLRQLLQEKIDSIEREGGYDAILLGYGLCGNSTAGLKAGSLPLILPRAHDCCTVFLGSRQKFLEHFKDQLSAQWSSQGYMERNQNYLRDTDTGKMLGLDNEYQDLVEKYGEENAQFVWETLHPPVHSNELIYIEIPETAKLGYLSKLQEVAASEGKSVRILEGDIRLIKALIHGDWSEEEFLIISPGETTKAVYDYERIISAEKESW